MSDVAGKRGSPCRPAAAAIAGVLLATACATQPPAEFVVEVPPGVIDARGRFGEIFCAVLQQRGQDLPHYRSCDEALSHVAASPPPSGRPVDLAPSRRRLVAAAVSGIGYSCVAEWLQPGSELRDHVRKSGYDLSIIDVDALSGSTHNAGQVRDAVMAQPADDPPRLVLLGYSKGAPDILEAVVRYPEIRPRIAAVVSVAGAIGGSVLVEDATEFMADLLRYFPGADCDAGDNEAIASLRPDVRKAWLAEHPLPADVRYYTVVTLPDPARISRAMKPSYHTLSKLDPRNDSQVIYSDQIVPGSTLLGFVNADHWAVAVPIARSHPVISNLFVTQNDYPREALLEAILRYVEEDLAAPGP